MSVCLPSGEVISSTFTSEPILSPSSVYTNLRVLNPRPVPLIVFFAFNSVGCQLYQTTPGRAKIGQIRRSKQGNSATNMFSVWPERVFNLSKSSDLYKKSVWFFSFFLFVFRRCLRMFLNKSLSLSKKHFSTLLCFHRCLRMFCGPCLLLLYISLNPFCPQLCNLENRQKIL